MNNTRNALLNLLLADGIYRDHRSRETDMIATFADAGWDERAIHRAQNPSFGVIRAEQRLNEATQAYSEALGD